MLVLLHSRPLNHTYGIRFAMAKHSKLRRLISEKWEELDDLEQLGFHSIS